MVTAASEAAGATGNGGEDEAAGRDAPEGGATEPDTEAESEVEECDGPLAPVGSRVLTSCGGPPCHGIVRSVSPSGVQMLVELDG